MLVAIVSVLGLALQAASAPSAKPVPVSLGSHPYSVSSASMQPTLSEGDVVVANWPSSACGRAPPPTVGDVVILLREGVPWVRRVVAGPRQIVQMIDGRLHIDGAPVLVERSNRAGLDTGSPAVEVLPNGRRHLIANIVDGGALDDTAPIVVPQDHWFTMGDNRDNAVDSRVHGPTAREALCGVVYGRLTDEGWTPFDPGP